MNQTFYLLGIFIASLFGWSSLFITINKLSPFISKSLALSSFYISLFLALTTTFSLLIYFSRLWFNRQEVYLSSIKVSLRQSALLSSMCCLSLVFQSMRVLTWWDALLLFLLVVFVELYFLGRTV